MFRSDAHAHEPDDHPSQQPSDNSDTDFGSPTQYTETPHGQTLTDHNGDDNETESEEQPPPDNANIDSNGSNMHHVSVRTPQ